MSCSFFRMRCDVVARGPFGPGFSGVFAKEQSNWALMHGRHGQSPEHLILRNEHTSLHFGESLAEQSPGHVTYQARGLPITGCLFLHSPSNAPRIALCQEGPWLRRAKCCGRNDKSRQGHVCTASLLETRSLVRLMQPFTPHPPEFALAQVALAATIENRHIN
jgi:hypothetical protein